MRQLGKNGPLVSAMGLGCSGMSDFYGPHDDRDSTDTIHLALDLGVNFLDTADMYGPFTNEEPVGCAIRNCRGRVVLATKFGVLRSEDPHYRGPEGRPEYVRSACEGSLCRLGADFIDLYYLHRVDPQASTRSGLEIRKRGSYRLAGNSESVLSPTVRWAGVF